MTVPTFLNSSFRYKQDTGVTDVQTILNSFNSETVTNGSPAWTSPSGFTNGSTTGTFKSPPDANGRFFEVVLTRTTIVRLEWKVTDQNGVTICDREIDIDAGGNAINYFTGQYHAYVESVRSGTAEVAQAGLLDTSPQATNVWSNWVFGNAYRTSGGTNDGSGSTTGQLFMIDNVTAGAQDRFRSFATNDASQSTGLLDFSGAFMYFPADCITQTSGGGTPWRWNGRMFQAYVCDSTLAFSTTKTVPVDDATNGTFRVVGLTTANNKRVMFRQA